MKEVIRELKEFAFFMLIIFAAVAISTILFGCGENIAAGSGSITIDQPVNQPQEQPEQTSNESSQPSNEQEQPNTSAPSTSGGGGGGGSSPAPECTFDAECNEGFECVEQHCVALPECRVGVEGREDILCVNPNDICSEQNTCVPKPCTEDSECVEPGLCLPDRNYTGEGDLPTVCREKSCPIVGETVDPESIVVPVECTEENTNNVFNLLQNVVHPDLSTLIEAHKICELEDQAEVLSQRFTDLDNIRISLDNFLASCNIGE